MNSCQFIINIIVYINENTRRNTNFSLVWLWDVRVANTTRCPMSRTCDDADIFNLPPDVITQPLLTTCLTKIVHFQMFVLLSEENSCVGLLLCIWKVLVQIFRRRLCNVISRSFTHSLQENLCTARCLELTHYKGKAIPEPGRGGP